MNYDVHKALSKTTHYKVCQWQQSENQNEGDILLEHQNWSFVSERGGEKFCMTVLVREKENKHRPTLLPREKGKKFWFRNANQL